MLKSVSGFLIGGASFFVLALFMLHHKFAGEQATGMNAIRSYFLGSPVFRAVGISCTVLGVFALTRLR
jgi:hypothetical protein